MGPRGRDVFLLRLEQRPALILAGLGGIGVDRALQPVAEPVEIALIGGELLAGLGLDMRRVWEDMHLGQPGGRKLAEQFEREPRFMFGQLHQQGRMNVRGVERR